MWWRTKQSDQKPLRAQLTEARDTLRRELEILQSPSTPGVVGGGPDNRAMIASLEAELRELTEALANLEPDDA
jgi:hypothetical protein